MNTIDLDELRDLVVVGDTHPAFAGPVVLHGIEHRAIDAEFPSTQGQNERAKLGNTGLLLTKVEFLKPGEEKNFCVVDAAMHDLMRPALYQAWMKVQPVVQSSAAGTVYDVVGPVCESGDWLAKDRALAVEQGDLLAIMEPLYREVERILGLSRAFSRAQNE